MASSNDEAAGRFLAAHPLAVLQVSADGRLLWANDAATPLLDGWMISVGGSVPRHLVAEVAALAMGGSRHGSLLGSGAEPVLVATRLDDGTVWLMARSADDPVVAASEAERRSKSAFLANMSHELRTPLNAILGYTELLHEDAADPDLATDLDRVHRAARHLLRLINDILDVSRIEAGRMGVFLETFEVAELLSDVAQTVEPLVVAGHNTLDVHIAPGLPVLRTDRTKLRQVLFNLLDNACKFTAQGTIGLCASAHDGGIRVTVSDTGPGIPSDELQRVFEPFTQIDGSVSRTHGGTGLGLALSRLLCRLLGGTVEVERRHVGSAFHVWLPGQRPETVTPAPAQRVEVHGQGEGTVLVIDDDRASRDLVTRFLVREGHRVLSAADGESALHIARAHRPDAITLDVMMPRVDGWEVLRRLKADPLVGHIPVVMVSIVDSAGLGFSLGASDWLTKPIGRLALLDALRPYTARGPGRVLVVDDNNDVRTVLQRTLQSAGWRVDEAADGAQALQYLAHTLPDVVLLDLLMPGIDGFQVLERLRVEPAWRDLPVLVVTAKHLSADEERRLEGGVRAVIEKHGRGLDQLVDALAPFLPSRRPPTDEGG